MTESDIALQLTIQIVALETSRRLGSHVLTEPEVALIADDCKRLADAISQEHFIKKKKREQKKN